MKFDGFIGPTYSLPRSKAYDCQRLINMYPELDATGRGKEQEVAAYFCTPGLSTLLTLAGGEFRGCLMSSLGTLYAVGGNKLYSINSSWAATELGTLSTSTGPVSIADNGIHVVVVDGSTSLYVWTIETTTFTTKTSSDDYQSANQVTFQDGYFIFNKPNSGQFYISGLNDVTFDVLDFATSEGNPDYLIGLMSVRRDLWLFNNRTIEVFFNSGNADFPFERIQGAFIEHGCAARFSVAKGSNNEVFWLGQNDAGSGIVYMATSYQPQRISTHAVESAIQSYSDVSDAEGYCYQQEGHCFYVLNFPSGDATWVFDATTGLWHERAYQTEGQFSRHRGRFHAFAYGKHIVGDYESGKIYEVSPDVYADDGREIIRRRVTPHISAGYNTVFHKSLQVDIEAGTGLDGTAQGTDPQAMMRFSDDGGRTWSNEKWVSFGKLGNYHQRAIWRRLGRSRDRVYEVSVSDPVKVVMIGAQIDVEGAAS